MATPERPRQAQGNGEEDKLLCPMTFGWAVVPGKPIDDLDAETFQKVQRPTINIQFMSNHCVEEKCMLWNGTGCGLNRDLHREKYRKNHLVAPGKVPEEDKDAEKT